MLSTHLLDWTLSLSARIKRGTCFSEQVIPFDTTTLLVGRLVTQLLHLCFDWTEVIRVQTHIQSSESIKTYLVTSNGELLIV